MGFVVVKSFSSRAEAEAAKGLLASCGIAAEIGESDPDASMQHSTSFLASVDLKVPEQDIAEAKDLLQKESS